MSKKKTTKEKELPDGVVAILLGKASNEKSGYHLSSQIDEEKWNSLSTNEKQLLMIDFDRPESIRNVTAGSRFENPTPNPPPSIFASSDSWKKNKKQLTEWWRASKESYTAKLKEFSELNFEERKILRSNIESMRNEQEELFKTLMGISQSPEARRVSENIVEDEQRSQVISNEGQGLFDLYENDRLNVQPLTLADDEDDDEDENENDDSENEVSHGHSSGIFGKDISNVDDQRVGKKQRIVSKNLATKQT
ncbi:predicted protein [Chaetoceros tenuissimus]|uniref:Uncharacterized protein n=1 Tax=Chaetoceros tenuissimus TaxID=426638 RepID=A0AAD3CZU7_9STRA|nr:predicted protein [Chaetoceros tenuissimus]